MARQARKKTTSSSAPQTASFSCSAEERRLLRNRLAKIAGQIAAVQRMIDENEDCELILQQMAAARAAMNRCFAFVLARMVTHSIQPGANRHREEILRSIAQLIERYV